MRGAYGKELGMVFLVMAGFALAGLIAVSFVKGTSLRSSIDTAQVRQILEQEDGIVEGRTSWARARTTLARPPGSRLVPRIHGSAFRDPDDESSAS